MARKPTPKTGLYPFHITARSNNKDWFSLPLEDCWKIFLKYLEEVEQKYSFKTHAFVLMSNHYHWLVSTPQANLGEGMHHFQTQTSWGIARKSGRINHVYGGRYKWTIIETPAYYANVIRYIYQNPLRAKQVLSVSEYPWSSINENRIRIESCNGFEEFIPPKNELLRWCDRRTNPQIDDMIQAALRRTQFQFAREKTSKYRYSGKEFL